MTGVLIRRRPCQDREAGRMKAEIRFTQLQAKGHQRLLVTTRSLEEARKNSLGFIGNIAC